MTTCIHRGVNQGQKGKAGFAGGMGVGERLMKIAASKDVHDERLWMPLAAATGAHGNTSCLVGTAEQVADAILKYYDLGIESFLLRGFDPNVDVGEFGRELIPRIRAGAIERDASSDAATSKVLSPAG